MVNNVDEDFYFRGIFMSLFIDIEFLLGNSIAKLLVGDNELQLNIVEFINPKIQLEAKAKLVFAILKKKHPVIHEKFKDDVNKLRDLVFWRNDFAHKRIEIDILNKSLRFIVFNNSELDKNSHSFQELNTLFEILKDIKKRMNDLLEIIPATQ
jgi:hypothetical protein